MKKHETTFLHSTLSFFLIMVTIFFLAEIAVMLILRKLLPYGTEFHHAILDASLMVFLSAPFLGWLIVKRKRVEEMLRYRLEVEKTVANISTRFISLFDFDNVINTSLADIGRLSRASRSYLFLLRDNGTIMDNTHEWCDDGVTPEIQNLQNLPSSIYSWWMKKLHAHEVIHITDVSKMPPEATAEKEILQSQGIKSLLVLPVYAGTELLGFIGFDNVKNTGFWYENDIALLQTVSEIIGNAFQRKRSEKVHSFVARFNAAMADISTAIISQASLEGISFLVLEYAKRLTGSKFGYVGYIDPHTGYLVSPTLTGDIWDICNIEDKNFIFKNFTGLWGWVLNNREPLLTNTPADDPRSSGTPAGHLPIHRFLSAPALISETLVGQVAVANSDRDYTEEDLLIIERLATLYAIAIQHWRAEETLRESEERYRRLVEYSPDGIMVHNLHELVFANMAVSKILGAANPEELVGKPIIEIIHPDYREIVEERLRIEEEGKAVPLIEEKFLRLDGTPIDVEVMSIPCNYRGKLYVHSVVRDITERKKADEQISSSLKEKEMLLREIHHRVKNNMQVISSLLSLQSEQIKDKNYLEMFKDSKNRVLSMSLVHENLYQSKDLAKIDFNAYIKDLANNLLQSYGMTGKIAFNINVDEVSLGVDSAIPCGLIINELITNSLKHAFPNGREGEIKIIILKTNENEMELIVGDNGVGMPEGIDFRKTESLGLHLVTMLAENQLNGTINLNRNKGTEFKIEFKSRQS